ncbi:MAG: hypothetical protein LKF79_05045 [Solobacterium sp.]|jgi:hypothetical protein|nr:hypothetical protein [Solobacterium sp.]MCH4223068.1 hypothetical protein [Solobacterium sp.]MCH4265989.1 hypothetical protein [Solobacterium sp.]
MPLPLLFIGVAAASSLFGVSKTAQAVSTNSAAKKIDQIANTAVEEAKNKLNLQRTEVSDSLTALGQEKLFVLNNSVHGFLESFNRIKNVDFTNSVGLEELKNLNVVQEDLKELKELGEFAVEVAGGTAAGIAGGAATALAAWGGVTSLAAASTGTAISTLSGAAATNATLAFFGGGSLAAGGLGVSGGIVVLGSLVAGPALAVMGLVVGVKTDEKLDKALANKAQSDEIVESLNTASMQCAAIRRRAYMFYTLMAHLDSYMLPLVWQMETILAEEGDDYRQYKPESQKVIAQAAQTAVTLKSVLDTPILTEDGELTEQSAKVSGLIADKLYKN